MKIPIRAVQNKPRGRRQFNMPALEKLINQVPDDE